MKLETPPPTPPLEGRGAAAPSLPSDYAVANSPPSEGAGEAYSPPLGRSGGAYSPPFKGRGWGWGLYLSSVLCYGYLAIDLMTLPSARRMMTMRGMADRLLPIGRPCRS